MADIQGEAQMKMMAWQVKGQQAQQAAMGQGMAQGEPGGPDAGGAAPAGAAPNAQDPYGGMQSPLAQGQQMQPGGLNVDIPTMAKAQAAMINRLPPQQQQFAIQNLRAQSPELATMVEQMLAQMQGGGEGGGGQQGGAPAVDMRPMPEAASPRRSAGMV
jgi:hypothetical protein